MEANKIRVQLIKSTIGVIPKHRATVRALGLRRLNKCRDHLATPNIKGMIRQVAYLLKVEDL